MDESWRTFDHTADIGLEIEAPTPARLYAAAALAVLAQVAECSGAAEDVSRSVSVEGEDHADLMVNWLNRALLEAELARVIWTRVEVRRLESGALEATLHGPRRDRSRMTYLREVKAVSHHGLELGFVPGRCTCRVILDL